MADGYAINELGDVHPRGLLVETVSPTRRAAIVNWLVVAKDLAVSNFWTDDMIEMAWRSHRGERTFCIKIEISASQEPGSNVTEPVDA